MNLTFSFVKFVSDPEADSRLALLSRCFPALADVFNARWLVENFHTHFLSEGAFGV